MRLQQLTIEKVDNIETSWTQMLNGDSDSAIRADFNQLFKMIRSTGCWDDINKCHNKPIYSCVVDDVGKVWGIIETVLGEHGSSIWVKLLDIHLSPEIENKDDTEETTQHRLSVFKIALLGTFESIRTNDNADALKVYGRTDVLVAFLRGMHDTFSIFTTLGTIKGINVSIEGRWLVFRKTSFD